MKELVKISAYDKKAIDCRAEFNRPSLFWRGEGDGEPEQDGVGGEGVSGTRYKRAPARDVSFNSNSEFMTNF